MAQIYLDAWIDELEALVGGGVPAPPPDAPAQEAERAAPKKPKPEKKAKPPPAPEPASDAAAPVCTQLEFKVGQITKVWYHEDADKLFCEEISCGEDEPRQIASGLRPHFTLEQMQGQRLLVVANLKAKKLVGFKSHGMVLCAAEPDASHPSGERVEFVEPPAGAPLGERVTYGGVAAAGEPATPAQVEKRKVWQEVQPDLATDAECVAVWKGHPLLTSAGPCKAKSIKGGVLR